MPGTSTSTAETANISKHGFRLLLDIDLAVELIENPSAARASPSSQGLSPHPARRRRLIVAEGVVRASAGFVWKR